MQVKSLEMKQGTSGSEGDSFEEEVCFTKTITVYCCTKSMLLDVLCILEGGYTPQQIAV
jgi:hypothetical protein